MYTAAERWKKILVLQAMHRSLLILDTVDVRLDQSCLGPQHSGPYKENCLHVVVIEGAVTVANTAFVSRKIAI